MRKISVKLLTLVTIFASAGLIPAQTTEDEITLKRIADYRQWTRVNQQPVVVNVPPVVVSAQQAAISGMDTVGI